MEAEFPSVSTYEQWVIDTLQNIGLAPRGEPLTFTELAAWLSITGEYLTPWEAETITHLSAFYVSRLTKYAPDEAAPPLESKERKIERLRKLDQASRDSWN